MTTPVSSTQLPATPCPPPAPLPPVDARRGAVAGWAAALMLGTVLSACHPTSFYAASTPRGAPTAPLPRAAPVGGHATEAAPPSDRQDGVGTGVLASSPMRPASSRQAEPRCPRGRVRKTLRGDATYYSDKLAGNAMASGERYDPKEFVAAHKTLPFGTVIRVTRVHGGHSVTVRVADRGPFGSHSRVIDLSRAAAARLHMLRDGVVGVTLEVLDCGSK